MNKFKKGDILIGSKRKFDEARHPIVFINGPDLAPQAVILTHSANFPCNIKLSKIYDRDASYFVAHLIEKMSEWGPYKKVGKLTKDDISLIEDNISDHVITWKQYKSYTKGGCPDHK